MRKIIATTVLLLALAGCSSIETGEPVASSAPPSTAPAGAVDQVIATISAAGLPIVNPRDNTGNCSEAMPCSRWVTADNVTVIEWNTPEAAASWTAGPLRSFLATPTVTVHTSEQVVDLAPFAAALGATYQPEPTTTAAPTAPVVHYGSCDDAEAAGAAPIQRGEPGYSAQLDRDGDGTACDS